MKRLLFATFGAAALMAMRAQTETNPPPVSPETGTNRAPIEILSDTMKGVMTNRTLVAVYRGNVKVNHPRWWIRSEVMTARFPVAGRRIENLLLESNVSLFSLDEKGRTNNARGDKAVYDLSIAGGSTNEIMVLTGNPATVVTPDFTMTSGQITCDLLKGTFDGGTNFQMTINAEGLGGSTNEPSLDLFKRSKAK